MGGGEAQVLGEREPLQAADLQVPGLREIVDEENREGKVKKASIDEKSQKASSNE